ncbi:uncharacterized protein F4822DRAFT_430583 [Hypoxylon trugodes]|uniref:uncharacterized protein n=1 Tax=Hypoxylon trugodes TaxID=326681 RepID=UPI00218EF211|nr:uncharacterized protein F4822DRAFT_430583 [Hypoxylon trugodes]KAI1387837.1 hypothetical protein F4822DRAFT_430583 [Hypoxylon trugodes]
MSSAIHTSKPKYPSHWVHSVLRCTYNDAKDIKQGLDELLGANEYIIKHRNGYWVVWAPRKLSASDESKLESNAHLHYRS